MMQSWSVSSMSKLCYLKKIFSFVSKTMLGSWTISFNKSKDGIDSKAEKNVAELNAMTS